MNQHSNQQGAIHQKRKGKSKDAEGCLDRKDFSVLLERLSVDIQEAAIFRILHSDINDALHEYSRELNHSLTFWTLSRVAYKEAVVHRLCRIYDGNNEALSLVSWLMAIKNSPMLAGKLDLHQSNQLAEDLRFVTEDANVKKLIGLRGNFIAHINRRNVTRKLKLEERFALGFKEIDALIARAVQILNRYGLLFDKKAWSVQMAGHRDYQFVLDAVRNDLKRRRDTIDAEVERALAVQHQP